MAIDDKTILPLYKALIENSRDVVTLLDLHGVIEFKSPSFTAIFGYGEEELIGTPILDNVHPSDQERALDMLKRILRGETIPPFIIRYQHKNGSWRYVEVIAHFLDESASQVMMTSRDVTEFEESTNARRLVDASLEAAFNASSAMNSISIVETGELLTVNDSWLRVLGWTKAEAEGKTAIELNVWGSEANRANVVAAVRNNGGLRGYKVNAQTRYGEKLTVLLDAAYLQHPAATRIYMSALDITEQERTEEKLRQSQRLDALGHLTGGIAHDFNNLLSVIMGHAELAASELGLSNQATESLAAIERASVTGANLIQQLLSFSRNQQLSPTSFKLSDHLEAMRPLLQTTIAKDIRLEIDCQLNNWYCLLDPLQFDNAILNMTINARDAMPNGGSLKFVIEERTVSESAAADYSIQPGDYLQLCIEDTGGGMSNDAINHAFDPFFTTKQDSGGSGLGLSMVFGFVTQSGGNVHIESDTRGTQVFLLLPRASAPVASEATQSQNATPKPRTERVLVVEDNFEVRLLVVKLLESIGLLVTGVSTASEAEKLRHQKFDLLLCDLMLPGDKKGPEVARQIKQTQPDIAVLYMSGYQQGILTPEDLESPRVAFIQKPFSKEDFAEAIAKLLNINLNDP